MSDEPIYFTHWEEAFAKVRTRIEAERDRALVERDAMRPAAELLYALSEDLLTDATYADRWQEIRLVLDAYRAIRPVEGPS